MSEIKGIIPKKIWLYWGNKTMSFLRYMTLYSLKKLNPDFTINLIVRKQKTDKIDSKWTEKQDDVYFRGDDYSSRISSLNLNIFYVEDIIETLDIANLQNSQLADIVGWKVLSTYGGVKSDMDILYHKPIPYEILKDIDVSLFEYCNVNPCGFLCGTPNVFWDDVFDESIKNLNDNYQSTGPLALTSIAKKISLDKYKGINIVKLENDMIYPFVGYEDWERNCSCAFKENVELPIENIGIHWYAGHPVPASHNAVITENNFSEYNSVICNIIKKLLGSDKNEGSY